MENESPTQLDYAPPELRSRRSKLAIASLLIPFAGIVLGVWVTKLISGPFHSRAGDVLGMLTMFIGSLVGLACATASMRRIRRSNGRLLGRPIAIVAIAFATVFILWTLVILFVMPE